jgi:hypothetical protein
MRVERKTWVEMRDGKILDMIPFTAWVNAGEGRELRFDFEVDNPPFHRGDPNLFIRLSFETIKAYFADRGLRVDHIIRGECAENGVRDCYVYAPNTRVPFAVIRPTVFAGHAIAGPA